jgi:hypothetical protein
VSVGLTGKLIWQWKEKEINKLLSHIEKHKATFILAIAGDTLRSSLSVEESVAKTTEAEYVY